MIVKNQIVELIELFVGEIKLTTYYDRNDALFVVLEHLQTTIGFDHGQSPVFFKYLREVVIPHKVAVYSAGIQLLDKGVDVGVEGFVWEHQLLMHDLSKMMLVESTYATHNFKDPSQNSDQQKLDFQLAWHHHKLNNPHHPEYWISVGKRGQTEFLPMPRRYVAEMVADWIGAGQTYGNSLEDWLPANLPNFYFHAQTAKILDEILTQLGFQISAIVRVRDGVRALEVK